MSNQPEARQTPLPDLLDRVPDDIVLGIPGDEPVFPSYTNIPIGRLAREAAAELRRLHAEVERLSWDSIHTCHSECQRPLCKLTRERDALLEALQALYDEQQGPPLIRHQAAWETAMQKARAAIKAVEENT